MTLAVQDSLSSKPIRDVAYEALKRTIIMGEVPAGTRIVETDYAKRLHISRTPLREALRKLEQEGLVEYTAHRGVVVCAFTIEDVEEIYTIRNTLEMLTLPAIIEKATPEDIACLRELLSQLDDAMEQGDMETLSNTARDFHARLTEICAQRRLLQAIQSQDEYIRRFSAMAISHENRRGAANEEHHLLVDYVEQKDLEKFQELMGRHIECSKQNCLNALAEVLASQQKNQSARKRRRAVKTEA